MLGKGTPRVSQTTSKIVFSPASTVPDGSVITSGGSRDRNAFWVKLWIEISNPGNGICTEKIVFNTQLSLLHYILRFLGQFTINCRTEHRNLKKSLEIESLKWSPLKNPFKKSNYIALRCRESVFPLKFHWERKLHKCTPQCHSVEDRPLPNCRLDAS